MWRWLKAKFGEHVAVEKSTGGEWDRMPSATAPVWKHRGCGDLVLEEYLLAHLREKHSKETVAQISLLSDGSCDAIAPNGFTLSMGQMLGLSKFVEVHMPLEELKGDFNSLERMAKCPDNNRRLDNNVRKGPWVH